VSTPIQIALIILVAAAAWSDFRTRRIPNWMTVPGAAAGLILHVVQSGIYGGLQSAAGIALGMAIFIGFYAAGGMGAGDVKLFGAVGAFAGPQAMVTIFVFTGLLGGIVGIALAVYRGRLHETLERTGELLRMRTMPSGPDALRLPYGAVIAGGTLISLVVLR
jgi:prepilin peptidase CpaA